MGFPADLFAELFFPDFIQCFAIDAFGGRGPGFQSADTDFYTTSATKAVFMRFQFIQGFFDFLY
jgi:hypothetical protein